MVHGLMCTEMGLRRGLGGEERAGLQSAPDDANGRSCSGGSCQAGRSMGLDTKTPSRAGTNRPGSGTKGWLEHQTEP